MIYAIVTIVTLQPKIDELVQKKNDLRNEVAQVQQENLELEEDIAALGTDESNREIARERLNMVEDGEIVYIDINK